MRLIYDVAHGTLFDVLDDPPGSVGEGLLLDDTPLKMVISRAWTLTVIALNSRGESAPSEPVSVTGT